jgi:hypothetical protein
MKEDLLSAVTAVGSALLSFFAPISMIVHVIMFVIALDCITAIMKAWKIYKPVNKGWRKLIERFTVIKSRGLKKTTLKFILYVLFIMAVYGTEIACFERSFYITNFAAFLIIFSELISIAENLDILLVTNKFTGIIKKIRKLFENKLVDKISSDFPTPGQPKESDYPNKNENQNP